MYACKCSNVFKKKFYSISSFFLAIFLFSSAIHSIHSYLKLKSNICKMAFERWIHLRWEKVWWNSRMNNGRKHFYDKMLQKFLLSFFTNKFFFFFFDFLFIFHLSSFSFSFCIHSFFFWEWFFMQKNGILTFLFVCLFKT